jgi:hypothetical protein
MLPFAGSGTSWASDPAEAPSSAVQTREQAHSLALELRNTVEKYGSDSVALQASFLVETLRAGATTASEVGVAGAAAPPHEDLLRIRVLTGLLFDPTDSTPESRLATVWGKVVAPVIGKMDGFDITPKGLELALGFGLQVFDENVDGRPDPAGDFELHGRVIRIPAAILTALATDEIDSSQVLSRALVADESAWHQPER